MEQSDHSKVKSTSSNRPLQTSWINRSPTAALFIMIFGIPIIALTLFFTFRPYLSTFDRSGEGQLSYSMPSRNGEYIAEMYGVPYGGAPGGVTVWVEVRKTVDTIPSSAKSIYRTESHGNPHLEWESENMLRIENWSEYSNETITLNIDEEIYDGRGWACKSLRTKDQYVRCLEPAI